MDDIIKMEHINKSFTGVQVLDDVNFYLKPGEVHALMGENGAGKSTLMKILAGIYTADSGEITVGGSQVSLPSVQAAMDQGICLIHQEICVVPDMTIAENIYLSHIPSKYGFVQKKERTENAKKVWDELGIDIDVNEKLSNLNIAQQQMVEIAKALSQKVRVLIMDEPTSSLTQPEIKSLFEQIQKLRKNGTSIIYISHRMEETFQICDSITVLRDGKLAGTRKVDEVNEDNIIRLMVGRELDESFHQTYRPRGKDTLMEVENLSSAVVHNISFSLKKGEVLGFAGLVGAGRTEIMNAIIGLDKRTSGRVVLEQKEINLKNMGQAIEKGIVLVPEDRKNCGLILHNTIEFNMVLPQLKKYIKHFRIDKKGKKKLVDTYTHSLSIKMTGPKQMAESLSGGNQQKVVISKWLACNPDILILDEPTRGIDVASKAEVYRLIHEVTDKGVSVILISSDLAEVMRLSSRLAVIYEGNLQKIIEMNDSITQENVMYYAMGGKDHEEK